MNTITGIVTDAQTGETLPGATVAYYVPGGGGGWIPVGTITDLDGRYSIQSGGNPLEFRFVGYETRTVPHAGVSPVNVQLKKSTNLLGEAVVFARKPWPMWLKVSLGIVAAIGIGYAYIKLTGLNK